MTTASSTTSAANSNVKKIRSGPVGRKDKEGQEAVIKLAELRDRIDDLVLLHGRAKDARTVYGDAVKAAAEKSGLLASVVRKFVAARASEDFAEHSRKAEQLALVFEKVGEISNGRML